MSDSESRSTDLLAFLEPLLRECAQRFGNASMSKLSEKTAAEMMHKCGDALRKVEEANKYGWEVKLCKKCLPHEEKIVQDMAHHAFTGD